MKKENIDQMRERHKKDIENLQNNCKHTDISGWMDYMWAPGHFGLPVKVCKFCGKIIKRKKMKFNIKPIKEGKGEKPDTKKPISYLEWGL